MSPRLPARFGLRAKLLSGAAVLLAFTAVIGLLGMRTQRPIQRQLSTECSRAPLKPLAELGIARAKFNESRALTNNHIFETSTEEKAKLWTRADGQRHDRGQEPRRGQGLAQHRSGTAHVRRADARRSTSTATPAREVLELSAAGKAHEAYALNKRSVLPRVTEAAEAFTGLFDSKVALAATEQRSTEAAAASARTRAIALLLAALVIGFAMAFWFSGRIQRTIPQILGRIQTAARALHDRSAQGASTRSRTAT